MVSELQLQILKEIDNLIRTEGTDGCLSDYTPCSEEGEKHMDQLVRSGYVTIRQKCVAFDGLVYIDVKLTRRGHQLL